MSETTEEKKEEAAGVSADRIAVNINEAAELLGVHHDTIRREIDRGKLVAFQIGRSWRIRTAAIQDYMKRLEKEAVPKGR